MQITNPALHRPRASRLRESLAALARSWPPLAAFASMALLYLLLNALLGAHLDIVVQAIALAALFLATPVFAIVCGRIASPRGRAIAATAGGALCAAAWMALIAVYFNSTPDVERHQPVARILRYGFFSVSLYAPLIWLACGGAHPRSPERSVTPDGSTQSRFHALAGAIGWLLAAGAFTASAAVLLDYANWWAPMSLFVGPVAGVVCALNAIRAARGAAEVLRWIATLAAAALILRLVYIGGYFLMVSGWLN
jgi:MFS family permease